MEAWPMKRQSLHFALLAGLLLPVLAFSFGGWAVVTVDELPEYVVTGKPVDLPFSVRQHGVTLLSGLSPTVTMKSGEAETTLWTRALDSKGHYVAQVTAPRAGDWTIRIQSGFGPSEITLLPVLAIGPSAPAPKPLAEPERGHHLFVAKGCVTCHMRDALGTSGMKLGPDLTGKRYVADYVAKFLADPESSPLSRTNTTTLKMPKLDLKEKEIAALVAFLNSEGQISSARW
jgi:mono/diheme cytochrome c family protein